MNAGLTVGTFFVRRFIVRRGEVRRRFQGHPDSAPERLLLLFRELFDREKKKKSGLLPVFPLFLNILRLVLHLSLTEAEQI